MPTFDIHTQPNHQTGSGDRMVIKNLVFEGGGVKGIAYGGALLELEAGDHLKEVTRVGGTSAGAITATLLAMGYTAQEVSDIVARTNFESFADNTRGVIRDALRLIRQFGFNKGDAFRKWIGQLIAERTGNARITFGEHHRWARDQGFPDLYVVGTNLSRQRAEVFSHERDDTRDMEVRQAVRISMSIPLYYRAVRTSEGDVMVDGGVTWNYPVDLFDQPAYLDGADGGNGHVNPRTLGLRLDSRTEIEHYKTGADLPTLKIKNIKSYTGALIGFLMAAANRVHLSEHDRKRTIFIDTIGVQTTEFKLSEQKIAALVASGRKAAQEYLANLA
ncbi:MAG: patatin-like phospholipase family protein [Candidatus Marinimicrobia bacterium]|nr:patatin-like phospholipase family protein [Candidatus Neomarinimicrobiota bacterium]